MGYEAKDFYRYITEPEASRAEYSEDAVRQERLVVELASGIKMLELGLPARLSEESLKTVEYLSLIHI